jgi:hypothetical protein
MDVPTIDFFYPSCVNYPCEGDLLQYVAFSGSLRNITWQHTQTAYVYFERQIFSSQTTVRMSRGPYTIREVVTDNPCGNGNGVDTGYSAPIGCGCVFGGSFQQTLGCPATGFPPVNPGLSDAGFTITCRVD